MSYCWYGGLDGASSSRGQIPRRSNDREAEPGEMRHQALVKDAGFMDSQGVTVIISLLLFLVSMVVLVLAALGTPTLVLLFVWPFWLFVGVALTSAAIPIVLYKKHKTTRRVLRGLTDIGGERSLPEQPSPTQ